MTIMVGISSVLYKQGIRVPEDISPVSLDDTNAAIATPPLTSVAFPVQEIAQIAVGMMQRHGVEIGPVIGSHAGPGILAIFFIGKHR